MIWPEKAFTDLGYLARGRSRHRPRNDESLYGGIYPFVQTADIKAANFYLKQYSQTYNEKGLQQSKIWPKGTLCITIAANIAETAILGIDACFPDSIIGFIPHDGIADVRFIKYFFDIFKERMQRIAVGAAQDNLSMEKLLSFKVPAPPFHIQKYIADILSAYDDLIENNRRRIQLLEEAAQYQYNLLMKESQPLKKVRLIDIADINTDSLNSKFQGNILYIDIASVEIGTVLEKKAYDFKDAPGRARRIVKHGDTIWSCVRPNRKSYALMWNTEENLVVSTGFAVIRPKLYPIYLYHTLTTDEFVQYLTNNATGAAYPAVTSKDFIAAQIFFPINREAIEEFEQYSQPIFSLKDKLQKQNVFLRQARDILLPQLMSGEIDVSAISMSVTAEIESLEAE